MKWFNPVWLSVFAPVFAGAFTVHEWGTFTTVHAPDGSLLAGLEREEERLPNFVHCHAGFAPANKGWSRPLANVTVKMETPVIYVYADRAFDLDVTVDFVGGSISQWYPQRVGGEIMLPMQSAWPDPPIDFGLGYRGGTRWRVSVLSPDVPPALAYADWETPQWGRARLSEANTLRGPNGEEEGFIFYRGVGNFTLPLDIAFNDAGELQMTNRGDATIPFVWIYDHRADAGGRYAWNGALAVGERCTVGPAKVHFSPDRIRTLFKPLVAAGLTESEAEAMLATWRESYFEREGLRVFWIAPRVFTDRVLPIRLTPAPEELARVIVGRSEVITPDFARELVLGFQADGGSRWNDDRYFLAYRELARRHGVAMPAAISTLEAPP